MLMAKSCARTHRGSHLTAIQMNSINFISTSLSCYAINRKTNAHSSIFFPQCALRRRSFDAWIIFLPQKCCSQYFMLENIIIMHFCIAVRYKFQISQTQGTFERPHQACTEIKLVRKEFTSLWSFYYNNGINHATRLQHKVQCTWANTFHLQNKKQQANSFIII